MSPDHCTICSRCLKKCPVKIDFGQVTMKMKAVLEHNHKSRFNPSKAAGLAFLDLENPLTIRMVRKGLIQEGFRAQRFGADLLKPIAAQKMKRPGFTTGEPSVKVSVINLVNRKLPKIKINTTSRKLLGIEEDTYVPIVRDPEKTKPDSESVFYFPGCGSERLFSEISIAVMGVLADMGVQVILPPGYRCCGHPQLGAGQETKAQEIITRNRVLFHRVANTLNYMDIKTVLVSCGTCLHQLREYNFEKIFPGCRVIDVHDYLREKGLSVEGQKGVRYIYHDPCHTPLKEWDPTETVNKLIQPNDGSQVIKSDRCCGESGTFAIARPDISTQVRFMKEKNLKETDAKLRKDGFDGKVKILTTCPGCLQGMSRYSEATKTQAEFLIVEMAIEKYGKNWFEQIVSKLKN